MFGAKTFNRMLSSNDVSPNHRASVQQEYSQTETFGPVRTSKRLIVDHIVLENFKSYAGRQVIGPFHEVRLIYVINKIKL